MPWGTFLVNALGSLLIGLSLRLLEGLTSSVEIRALVTIGLLGAFTTFSTYAYETVALARDGAWGRAGLYAFGSLAVGVLAVVVGFGLAEAILKGRG
jgi:CrcB protein